MFARLLPALVLAFGCTLAACGAEPDSPGLDVSPPAAAARLGAAGYLALCCGTRETVAIGITAIENLTFSSDGRLFASGDDGVFELVREASGALRSQPMSAAQSCKFAGMAVVNGTLYAACYDFTDSYLYAASLAGGAQLQSIFKLAGVALANGMTADREGHLYVADSLGDSIQALTLSADDPLRVTGSSTFLASTGGFFPNGLKEFDSTLYFSDFTALRRVSGKPQRIVTFVDQLTFYDDLYVDANGVVVANFLAGSLEAYTPTGLRLGESAPGSFDGPSAVIPANGRLGFTSSDLLVAEKNANQLAVYHLPF